jgi:hypothetical protein
MAAQPRTRKLKATLLKWGREEFGSALDDGSPVDSLTWPLTRLAGGWTIQRLANEIAVRTGEPTSRQWVSHILNKGDKSRLDAARREAAGVLAEQAVEISDAVGANPDATTAQVQSARLQVETRKWLAGVLDAHTFVPSQRHDVAVDLGALHLSALRARAVELRQQLAPVPVEIMPPADAPKLLGSGEGD